MWLGQFKSQDARLLVDIDQAGLADVAAAASSLGVEAVTARCDLTQTEEITATTQALLDRWGGLDILINNAGVAYYGPTNKMTAQQWDWLMAINLLAPIQLIRELYISYIYVGQLERSVYDPAGLAKFDRMQEEGNLDLVYENERVRIYEVTG